MAETVGLLGLGLVGQALIRRLHGAGYAVCGYDRRAAACEQAAAQGVTLVAEGATLAAAVDLLLLSLPDSAVVSAVLWDEGVGEALRPGSLVLDTTTGRAEDARTNHDRLRARGVHFADVCLSGSSEDIAAGRATALVGDTEGATYAPLVASLAARQFFLGKPGAGCLAKLVVNHVMGLNRAALAEGLALGERVGLGGELLLGLLQESAAYSRVMDMKGERMVHGNYAPASRLGQHAKDVRLILELAAVAGALVPLEEVHARLLAAAQEAGLGELDNAALIEVFRRPAQC